MKEQTEKSTTPRYDKYQQLFKELDYGIDIRTNTLFLSSDITPETLYETLARLNMLVEVNKKKPITLMVSSFGGDVYSMFGIHDYIRTLPVKVNTICIGMAMSAAAFLLASGTGTRKATANSTIMFHELSSAIEGKTETMRVNMAHVSELQGSMEKLLSTYSKKPVTFWKQSLSKEFYITAKQALEYGVIDEIISIV